MGIEYIPLHWVEVAIVNGDAPSSVKTIDGKVTLSGMVSWADTPPVVPTLQGDWVHYGYPYGAVTYQRKGGVVYVKGLVKSGGQGTIFTLPEGFRPSLILIFGQMTSASGIGRIDVITDGKVSLTLGESTGVPSGWTSLTLSFIAEQ